MREMTTPPPPGRIHTPPAPLHGDSYEPYSPPRRSTRASSQRKVKDKPSTQGHIKDTASPVQKSSLSQTLSPPSSPEPHRVSQSQQTPVRPTPVRRSLFTRDRPTPTANPPLALDLSLPTPQTMLPTPNKTPQKRDPTALHSTARILNFKPAMLDHVMPSPRKRTKMRLTLDDHDTLSQDEIKVYTDTQNRIPDGQVSDDNPFVGPRKTRSKTSRSSAVAGPSNAAPVDSEEAAMEQAVRDGEGIIYVFRGKKIFRRFQSPDNVPGADMATSSNARLKRLAGASASRPLTRSSLQPRLLFPSAHQEQEEEEVTDADEEALTDIEEDNMPRSNPASFQFAPNDLITPAKALAFQPATPPSSHRQTRSTTKHLAPFSNLVSETGPLDFGNLGSPSSTPIPQAKAKAKRNASPFYDWHRTKPTESTQSATHGQKRSHPSTSDNEEPSSKRTRAAVSHSKT